MGPLVSLVVAEDAGSLVGEDRVSNLGVWGRGERKTKKGKEKGETKGKKTSRERYQQ